MLRTVQGEPVKDLANAVIVSLEHAQLMRERIAQGKCACLACLPYEPHKPKQG